MKYFEAIFCKRIFWRKRICNINEKKTFSGVFSGCSYSSNIALNHAIQMVGWVHHDDADANFDDDADTDDDDVCLGMALILHMGTTGW